MILIKLEIKNYMNILQIKWSFNQMLIAVEPYDERKKIEKKNRKVYKKSISRKNLEKKLSTLFFFTFDCGWLCSV